MINWILLLVAQGFILLWAKTFTKGLEWFGKKMDLPDNAWEVFLPLSATLCRKTLVPIVAIMFGSPEPGHKIGVGVIIGAPFILGNLALFIRRLAVVWNRNNVMITRSCGMTQLPCSATWSIS